jgi:hypothetical protein
MKKIFMIMTLFLVTVTGYSKNGSKENPNESQINSEFVIKKQTPDMYDFTNFDVLKFDSMSNLSVEQQSKVVYIMSDFNKKMTNLFYSKNRKKKMMRVLNRNVKEMSCVLDVYQYRKYLMILNVELNRRGIDLF